ncbi:MAG: DUF4301 family protein [Melioribacteraceae bacterium]|nr:MAG: DUF4301 family protein [Melioribacteraceae bacterium]
MNTKEFVDKMNLTIEDLKLIEEHGLTLSQVSYQVEQLKKGTKYLKLSEACTVENGILRISGNEKQKFIKIYEDHVKSNLVIKFVPASGAASRMFKKLESFMLASENLALDQNYTSDEKTYIQHFFKNIKNFPFYTELSEVLEKNKLNIEKLLLEKKFKEILEFLLTPHGMNYSNLPKALIQFHQYKNESRVSLEEQIVEAIEYIKSSEQSINLHFTISEDMKGEFEAKANLLAKKYRSKCEISTSFSFQKKSTDTVALDSNQNIFRENDKILFRPGGHGALIENLNELDADLIFIKNIDNVQREENLSVTIDNKKLLGGLLIKYQSQIHSYITKLNISYDINFIEEIEEFLSKELGYQFDLGYTNYSLDEKQKYLLDFLNRPIRVCGVVVNEGHPGGGPFWVEDENGNFTKQIVEGNQIKLEDDKQRQIYNSSTHFNPVDIVCGIKDAKRKKFDLIKYVDNQAVLVSKKSKDGKELNALELPGLWNGGMSDWITIFVEVPSATFTPVKEVNDLLKNYHLGSL